MDISKLLKNNLFQFATKEDVEEIKNVIDYAKGLIIHNKDLADSQDTIQSLDNADIYIKAYLNTDNMKDRKLILDNYTEYNPYYKELYDKYQIEYYVSRTAKDYHIFKSTNNTLSENDKFIFEEAYYEVLTYHNNVTKTLAFKNQGYAREWEETYIIFMTIQKYINKKMDAYYNIDTYNKYQLKNAFISNGLDYFDSIPINYQRRILKSINDLIRNKGTEKIFEIILDIFGYDNINIYKYILCKTGTITSDNNGNSFNKLLFYKTEYDKNLDINHNVSINYNDIVKNDPFWKTNEYTASNKNFNITKSKYISVDVVMDMLKSTYSMSYFFSFLNKLELEHREKLSNSSVINKDLIRYTNGKELSDFDFFNKDISKRPINIYDALITIIVLVFKFHGYKDNIIKKYDSLNAVFGYNDINSNIDITTLLNDISSIVYNNSNIISDEEKDIIKSFINNFRLKNFYSSNEIGFEEVMKIYNSSIIFKNQYDVICDKIYTNAVNTFNIKDTDTDNIINIKKTILDFYENNYTMMKDYLENDKIYEFMNLLYNLILENHIEFYWINDNTSKNALNLFSKFINYKFFSGDINKYKIYNIMYINKYIQIEISNYISNINRYDEDNTAKLLNDLYSKYMLYIEMELSDYSNALTALDIAERLIDCMYATNKVMKEKYDKYTDTIYLYKNLEAYLILFMQREGYYKTLISIQEFIDAFNYNENTRKTLENLLVKTNNYDIYKKLKNIWNIKFTGDFNTEIYNNYSTFSEYLNDNNIDLYKYCNVFLDDNNNELDEINRRDIIKERIFNISESIENYLGSDFRFIVDNSFVYISNYIKDYIKTIINVFKSYTITLLDNNNILKFDSKYSNSIRLFDNKSDIVPVLYDRDYTNIKEYKTIEYTIYLQDNININDNITIESE